MNLEIWLRAMFLKKEPVGFYDGYLSSIHLTRGHTSLSLSQTPHDDILRKLASFVYLCNLYNLRKTRHVCDDEWLLNESGDHEVLLYITKLFAAHSPSQKGVR